MAAGMGAANLGGVADPRLGSVEIDDIGTHRDSIIREMGPPETNGHNTIYLDNSITFENYHYWAKRARQFEDHLPPHGGTVGLWQVMLGVGKKKPIVDNLPDDDQGHAATEKKQLEAAREKQNQQTPEISNDAAFVSAPPESKVADGDKVDRYGVTESEWQTAQRAARTASWGAIFFLITTDILGPYSVPYSIAQLGYGPGVAIFVVFGVLSYYSAMQLWKMFKGLDSPRYPIRNYGDLGFRLFGNWMRVTANFLQSFQFFLNVALCIVSNGQALAQMAVGKYQKGFLCFVVAEVIFTVCGFILSQIRTLQRLGWLANLSVWLNIIIIVASVCGVYIYPPNLSSYIAKGETGPVRTSGGLPAGLALWQNVNGVFNGVFAFGGATLFNELMAEMRRPHDFWKALLFAEIFITAVYLIYGLLIYSKNGQYTFNPSFQGIPVQGYNIQTLCNALYFIVSLIAGLLYGNIGLKVFYAAVLRDTFKFPPLETKKGKITWVIMAPTYWALAFVLGAAVPQISNLTAFEGALTIMQFSYTFPPLFMVVYHIKRDAMLPEEKFDPITGQTNYVDSGPKRWWRGFRKQFLLNSWDSLYFLAALATAILGIWASIKGMIVDYKGVIIVPYGCANPAGA